jgi:Cellulase (glycosyl hydrolase family 5)
MNRSAKAFSVQRATTMVTDAIAVFLVAAFGWGQNEPKKEPSPAQLDAIAVAPDGREFIHTGSRGPFRPWGFNYGNGGRLIEDFWENEWDTIAADFQEMKTLGANVVRVHLQFGRFMVARDKPDEKALRQLRRLLRLAESTGLCLDLTGLACYRPADTPKWYDVLDESDRWNAQAAFWRAIAGECAHSPAVFCYDLINEPLSPAQKREPSEWYSGKLFGGYDFLQYVAIDPKGRTRDSVAAAWIDAMTKAIRESDHSHLITVGMLPWVTGWGHLSGFVPKEVARHVDFLSVHIYPKSREPAEARRALKECAGDKPVVIEETFPLECSAGELKSFLIESRSTACGWIWHYDGEPLEALDNLERDGKLTIPKAITRESLRLFVDLRGAFSVKSD